jgi:hypothetical protein
MKPLCEYEIKILRHLRGDDMPDLNWGAAMGAAIEYLQGVGFIYLDFSQYKLTKAGTEYLEELKDD